MVEYYRFKTVHDMFVKGLGEEARVELGELQRRYVALCDENTSLKMQMQEYEDILYIARNLTFDGEFYWLHTGSIKQGPFCPGCYNRDGLLIRLWGEIGERHCTICREDFRRPFIPAVAAAVPQVPEGERVFRRTDQTARKAKVIPFNR